MPDETVTTENIEQPDAADIESLRKLAAERDQYLDMAQRTRAEFENYQKRARKERDDERRYLNSAFAHDLLPVLDNLERALQAAQQAGDAGALAQGVALVQNQFLEQLKRHGVAPIDAQGKPFDPNLHQAVMQQPSDQAEPNTVLQVLEPGYTIHERVLRPAKVIVSSKQ
jgi:molecular chaperone GrpE